MTSVSSLVRGRSGKLLSAARRTAINLLAGASALAAMTNSMHLVALGLGATSFALFAWSRKSQLRAGRVSSLLGVHGAARSLLVIAAVALATDAHVGGRPALAATALLAVLLIGIETAVRGLWTHIAAQSFRLPGVVPLRPVQHLGSWLVPLTAVTTIAIAGLKNAPEALDLVLLCVVAAASGAVVVSVLSAAMARASAKDRVKAAIDAYAPSFLVVFSAPAGSEYQLTMWLDYLERIDRRFVVVLREAACLDGIVASTTAPVVVARTLAELETVMAPSVTTAFYVNNSMKNGHAIRFSWITHVQLLHGDSDKPSSFNPVTAMFDRIFVAGQAGIDRYANNDIDIPASKFRVVGRPQVAGIARAATPDPGVEHPRARVLYAPTWTGLYGDANYCSLPFATQIVSALLERGVAVTFRPHPYSYGDAASRAQIEAADALLAADAVQTRRAHVFGREANAAVGIIETFNASDALVSDVSSVPADYLFSGKPFVITHTTTETAEEYLAQFPLARAAYRWRPGEQELSKVLAEMLETDPLREVREHMNQYYLGAIDRDTYEDAFVLAARETVDSAPEAARRGNLRDEEDSEGQDEGSED